MNIEFNPSLSTKLRLECLKTYRERFIGSYDFQRAKMIAFYAMDDFIRGNNTTEDIEYSRVEQFNANFKKAIDCLTAEITKLEEVVEL
jgi:hypothetical protein